MSPRRYTSNAMKGGAMLRETLALLREWKPGTDPGVFASQVIARNTLGKATRARMSDILRRIFFRRFTAPGAPPTAQTQAMILSGFSETVVTRLLYLHAALADDLLYDFATLYLDPLYHEGRWQLDTSDGMRFIDSLIAEGAIAPPWSENIKVKTARGLLAALRDFGLLEGRAVKTFAAAHLPLPVFVYVTYYLRDQGVAGARLVSHPHWKLFFLTPGDVERLFAEAHQEGHVGYYAAGGTVRVEWSYDGLASAVRALTQATH